MKRLAKIILIIGMAVFIVGRFMGPAESAMQISAVVMIFGGVGLAGYSVRSGK